MTRPTSQSSPTLWADSDLECNPHTTSDKGDRVQRMFTAIARSYDLNNRVHSFGRDQAWRRRVVKQCRVKSTDDVLDVACGTGDLSLAFAQEGPASVTGLDFTEAMLEVAREKQQRHQPEAKRPMTGNPVPVHFVQGDAMALPFEHASFDVASIAFGIRNVSDPAAALAEFHRVLRPGGRLAILEFSQPKNPLIRFCNNVYCSRIMPITATLLAKDRSGAYRYLPRSVQTFLDSEQLRQAMTDAGFSRITQSRLTFGVCTVTLGFR